MLLKLTFHRVIIIIILGFLLITSFFPQIFFFFFFFFNFQGGKKKNWIPILRFQVMHDYVCFLAPIDYCVEKKVSCTRLSMKTALLPY